MMTLTFQTYFFVKVKSTCAGARRSILYKNRFNVQLSFSTSSSERHRLDFNAEHWSRNYQKVDPRKFWKSPRRSHPKTPLSKTSKVAPQKFRNPSPGSSTHRRYRLVFSAVTASDSDASLASGRSRPAASFFFVNTWSGVCGLVWSLFIDHSP